MPALPYACCWCGAWLQDWRHPPFSGAVADGAVWGRGAQDVKVGVVSLVEAALALLRQGFQPARSLLFAFGHDPEVGGDLGASERIYVIYYEWHVHAYDWCKCRDALDPCVCWFGKQCVGIEAPRIAAYAL